MKKTLFVVLLAFFSVVLVGCTSKEKEKEVVVQTPPVESGQQAARQVISQIAPLIGKQDSDIEESFIVLGEEERGGYMIRNEELATDPTIPLANYFKSWFSDINLMADGPGASQMGYEKGNIYCITTVSANASPEEIVESETYPEGFTFLTSVLCGEGENKATTENNDTIMIEAYGEEPFWMFLIDGNTLTFGTPDASEETHTITITKNGDDYSFSGEGLVGNITKKTCVDTSVGEEHEYAAHISIFESDFLGCADSIQAYAEGDDFFKYGQKGPIIELGEKTGYHERDQENLNYIVEELYGPYMQIGTRDDDDMWGFALVLKKTQAGREKIWEGQDLDYDTCKTLQETEPAIMNWGIFQNCSEDMARG